MDVERYIMHISQRPTDTCDDFDCQFVIKDSNFWLTTSDGLVPEHAQAQKMTVESVAGTSQVSDTVAAS